MAPMVQIKIRGGDDDEPVLLEVTHRCRLRPECYDRN